MTLDELSANTAKLVAEGKMTKKQRADAIAAFELKYGADGVSKEIKPSQSFLDTLKTPQPAIRKSDLIGSIEAAPSAELSSIAANESGLENEEKIAEAAAELTKRKALSEASFLESLTMEGGLERLGKSVLKGPAQLVAGVTEGMPALVLTGIGAATNDEASLDAAGSLMDGFAETNQTINENFGMSEAVTPAETFAENIITGLVPGSLVVKSGSFAADFAVDQTMRELTDTSADAYSTIFDRLGLTNDQAEAALSPLAVLPLAIAGGVLSSQVISRLKAAPAITPPSMKSVHDFDKFAPDDLKTMERSTDAWKAYILDKQSALTTIVNRAGLPDPDDVAKTIATDTHAAARVRAGEAVASGRLSVAGKDYTAPVSVKSIFDAAFSLPQEARLATERYINFYDMIDDAKIALAKAMAPGSNTAADIPRLQAVIASHSQELARIARNTPIVKKFHGAYNMATSAVRDFLEGDILGTKEKQWLDLNRQNYVPLDISPVDKNASFVERMIQTQTEGIPNPDDWFLRARNSSGNYNIDARGNPFELLAGYTEAAMNLAMTNNARKTVVDAVLNSTWGKETMRLVKETDDLAGNVDRIVTVFRDGVKEQYITSKLTAQLLKFDPYVAKHPWMFAMKRLFEQTSTGPASITFAPISAIRDTIAGGVLAPKGMAKPNPLEVVSAVPKQLWAKAQKSISDRIFADMAAGNTTLPSWLMDAPTQQKYAQKMADNYINSMYHLAQKEGGFDASLMTSNIQLAQSMMGELKRSIRESNFMNSPAMQSAVARLGRGAVTGFVDGFVNLFDSIRDAPRFAALEKTVKNGGKSVEDASILAKQMTGDTSRSGLVFSPDGKMKGVDAVDRGIKTLITPTVGRTANFLRETAPYVNPMLQGTRQLMRAVRDDPVGAMANAWMYVGLPAFGAYAWNEMAGKEYNDYAMSDRSATDVAMNLYVAVPGLPPEQGIEIPLPHELLLFNSPFTRYLYGLREGDDADEMSFAMQQLATTILSNSTMVSSPVVLNNVMTSMGYSAPSGFVGSGGSYEAREDFQGFLPQNIENLIRSQFSTVGNTAMQIAYAMEEDGTDNDWNNFVDTITTNVKSRLPGVKGGSKTKNTTFSIPAQYDHAKSSAMDEFWPYWDNFYNANKKTDVEGITTVTGGKPGDVKGAADEDRLLPLVVPGSGLMEKPTNPFYETVGFYLVENARRNNIGIAGVQDYISGYSKMASTLRKYNSGDATALKQWDEDIRANEFDHKWAKKMKVLIEDHDIDLSKFEDRVKMINLIEHEKSYMIAQKLELFDAVETQITEELRAAGLIGPTESFRIDKHLKPFDDNPLGLKDALAQGATFPATP